MQLNHKVKLVTFSQHAIAIAGVIYYGLSSVEILISILLYFVYFGLGTSAGFHKLFCHKSFKTNKFWRKFLLWTGTFTGFGSSIAWSVSHRLHHKNSDKGIDLDPYYPQGGLKEKFIAWWVTPRNVTFSPLIVKDQLADPEQFFIHQHYFKILLSFVVVLTIINPWLTVFAWALPNLFSYHAIQAVGTLSHNYGDRPHDNHDNSRDNYLVGILTFGEGFQNTHHWNPRLYKLHPHDLVGILIDKYIKVE